MLLYSMAKQEPMMKLDNQMKFYARDTTNKQYA